LQTVDGCPRHKARNQYSPWYILHTSALVGRGFFVILSSICVAQIDGLPARLHLASTCLVAKKTFSGGISILRVMANVIRALHYSQCSTSGVFILQI
jgi:hypothetical protein